MTGRSEVICNACGGELRDWTRTSGTDEGHIEEGQCRDCRFYTKIHVDDGEVEILMGGEFR